MQLDVILASASPRRNELLSLIFRSFSVIPSDFDEAVLSDINDPIEAVVKSSSGKAGDIAGKYPESLVIAADTVVAADQMILGKPRDTDDAARMLRMLSNKTHQVYTGVTVAKGDIQRSDFECTDVTFRELSEDIITRYISSGEPMDKAGAYAIQGVGAVLIRSIRGCYFNVVGLPIFKLSVILEDFGIQPLSNIDIHAIPHKYI